MKRGSRASLRRSVLWLAGAGLCFLLLAGGAYARLQGRRAEVDTLEAWLSERLGQIERGAGPGVTAAELARTQATLLEWQELVGDEGRQVAEVSLLARESGVALLTLESLGRTADRQDAGATVSAAHRVRGLGTYRQVADFLERVYASPGLAGVDELELVPETDAGPGLLLATVRVSWFAPSPEQPSEGEVGP